MKKKDYGTKYICYQCGCRFYDMRKPQPVCPKCGVNQAEAPQKGSTFSHRPAAGAVAGRAKPRKRKEEAWDEAEEPFFLDEDEKTDSLEDGLSLIEDDALAEGEEDDSTEIE